MNSTTIAPLREEIAFYALAIAFKITLPVAEIPYRLDMTEIISRILQMPDALLDRSPSYMAALIGILAAVIQIIFMLQRVKHEIFSKNEFSSRNSSHSSKLEKRNNGKNLSNSELDFAKQNSIIASSYNSALDSGIAINGLNTDLKSDNVSHGNIRNVNGGNLVDGLVISYHQQALSQAKFQFLFSVFAAIVGFFYILYASSKIDDANLATTAKIIPGIIIDVIAAIFFKQAEQTRQRATELYDRLRKDQQMRRAESIADSIENEQIRSAIKAQVSLHMAGLSPKEIDIISFVSNPYSNQRP
ncbi:TRADD-N-associated membrane domain-containing protein [Azospirillum griseum]|uniref:Cyanobacterial TRADD-N associated 2 transmembrane domain-containing protein n=1 Tax=Azospirillum griseum TaxID=2496639 RepID=A0A3S0KE27_9PROT|nr:hypothetical protein [Azospirillum griseum]RTR24215.1 hypothetical protein EJ903_00025 [Azospirillum griseum]